jgi:hypothetical protein
MERLTLIEAAKKLNISREAAYKRVQRGTLEYSKGVDGHLYVYLDTDTAPQEHTERTTESNTAEDSDANPATAAPRIVPTYLPIMISLVSVLVTVATFYTVSNPWGSVGLADAPAGWVIVRGIAPILEGESEPGALRTRPYPSDHVVMPLEFVNNTGGTILIRDMVLVFSKLGTDGQPIGDQIRFFKVDKVPTISNEEIADLQKNVSTSSRDFTSARDLQIEAHSVATTLGVYRVEGWLAPPNECFRFIPGDVYEVDLEFRRVPAPPFLQRGTTSAPLIERLTIQTTADFLSPYGEGGIGWDYFSLLPGSRSTHGDTPRRADPLHRPPEKPPCSQT